ncbi:MAG: hypothetical protein ABRQ25_02935 [Clostridiaceae bacterium]
MRTETLDMCNFNFNIGRKVFEKVYSFKKLIIFLLLVLFIICSAFITRFNKITSTADDTAVSDFKFDITMLSETASVIEAERKSNKDLEIYEFGSDGKLININDITPDLAAALTKIADIDNDGNISNEEMLVLGIMRLKPEVFQNEMKRFQFHLKSADRNLKNYLVLTKGKYSGTILYNGPLHFIDNDNKQFLGLELFK